MLLWSLVIGVIAFVIVVLCRVIANWTKTGVKKSVGLSRVGYGVCSIVLVPILFIFSITVTSLIFTALSGSEAAPFLSSNNITDVKITLGNFENIVTNTLYSNSWKLVGNNPTANWGEGLNRLETWVRQIQQKYGENQGSEIYTISTNLLNAIGDCKATITSNLINEKLQGIINLIDSGTINAGQRLTDVSNLQEYLTDLSNVQIKFNNFSGLLVQLKEKFGSFSWDSPDLNPMVAIFGEDGLGTQPGCFYCWLMYCSSYQSGSTTNGFQSIANLFTTIYSGEVNGVRYYCIGGYDQLYGGLAPYTGNISYILWTDDVFTEKNYIGLNAFYSRLNPISTFQLAAMLNGWVQGKNYPDPEFDVGKLYTVFYTSLFSGHLEREVIGVMGANIMMGAMFAFVWYVLGRLFELVVLWFGSVIVAFKDDGEGTQFKLVMRTVFKKTISIIFIEFVFIIVNAVINMGIIKTIFQSAPTPGGFMFDPKEAAVMLSTTILFAAAFPMGNTLNDMIFGEPGQLRTLGDQYNNIMQGQRGMALVRGGQGAANTMGQQGNQLYGQYNKEAVAQKQFAKDQRSDFYKHRNDTTNKSKN